MIVLAQHAASRRPVAAGEAACADGLEAWFEWSSDALVLSDDAGRIVDANDTACAALGLSRDEIVGEPLAGFRLPSSECYGTPDAAGDCLGDFSGGDVIHDERLFEHGDGSVRLLELVGIPHLFGDGLHLTILRDLTRGALPAVRLG